MSTITPQERAVWQGRALDLVDRAIEQVYEQLLAKERKKLGLEDLMHCETVSPEFEYRLTVHYKLRQKFPELHLPEHFWFYSLRGLVHGELVIGALIGGDLMVVEASTREGADKLAREGLAETFAIAKDLKYNALALPDVVQDPNENLERIASGRRVNPDGPPINGDMAEKIHRIFGDSARRMARRRRLH